ncbi:MAG: hypothetical protein R5N75_08420 [Cutibacterium granulosum]|uniref:hypothetical protein n=1 Tax=Cutibacterium granulosum TaxID=33011 RepID=UPI002B2373D8|nr:hypothetical protein [Cutibacterium granulosum]MEA5660114.1 hypothetical protein [Cutibacterium granulosum]
MPTTPNQPDRRRTPCPHPDICKVRSHLTDAARAECERKGKIAESHRYDASDVSKRFQHKDNWFYSPTARRFRDAGAKGRLVINEGRGESFYRGEAPLPEEIATDGTLSRDSLKARGLDERSRITVHTSDDGTAVYSSQNSWDVVGVALNDMDENGEDGGENPMELLSGSHGPTADESTRPARCHAGFSTDLGSPQLQALCNNEVTAHRGDDGDKIFEWRYKNGTLRTQGSAQTVAEDMHDAAIINLDRKRRNPVLTANHDPEVMKFYDNAIDRMIDKNNREKSVERGVKFLDNLVAVEDK